MGLSTAQSGGVGIPGLANGPEDLAVWVFKIGRMIRLPVATGTGMDARHEIGRHRLGPSVYSTIEDFLYHLSLGDFANMPLILPCCARLIGSVRLGIVPSVSSLARVHTRSTEGQRFINQRVNS